MVTPGLDVVGLRVPFGLREGRMYSPSEVANGLRCGCVCPSPKCGAALIANHPTGGKRAYFSHHSGSSCEAGYETAVHLMAKQIIEDAMWVTLPAYTVPIETPMPDGVPYTDEVFFEPHKSQPFRTVVQEQSAGTLRPDLTARLRNGSILFIEIYVTHAVEEAKAKALDNLMEVDLSNLTPEQKTDPDLLRQAVLESAPRRWFLCSLYDNLKRVKQAQATLSASAPDEWMRREQAKRELKLKRERAAAQAQAREQGRKRMEANKKSRDWQRRQHQHLIDHLAAARSDD